jgi:predicted TPR repeat methyltransferase
MAGGVFGAPFIRPPFSIGTPVHQTLKMSIPALSRFPAVTLPTPSEIEGSIALWRAQARPLDELFMRRVEPAKALRFYGLKLWEAGHAGLAAEVLRVAAALSPQEAQIWSDLAGAFYASGKRSEAAAAMTASLDLDDAQPRGFLFLAMIRNDEQDFGAAETAYRQALALDPTLTDASFGLGLLCFRQRRFEQAAELMRFAISQGNETVAAWACLGQALYLVGDFSGAAEAFAAQAARHPVEPAIVQRFALCRLVEASIAGPVEEALELYREVAGPHAEDLAKVTLRAFQLLSGYGHREAALRLGEARRQWVKDDPVERYLLAAVAGEPLERAPEDYLVAYFDGFADGFDQTLLEILDYRVPEKLAALVQGTKRRFPRMLDLGCGTGLAGPLLRKLGTELMGIDISPRMLEKAKARGTYDRLENTEFVSFLEARRQTFDLIFASDALVYFGDLAKLLRFASASLAPKGLLAFNIETTEVADFAVLPSGRFAHRVSYVEGLARADFLRLTAMPTTLRLEANRPVAGTLFIMQKR